MKKSILTLLLFGGMYSASLLAQEVRLQGNMLILGYINDPFIGAGAGIEAGMGEHFTLNFDANWGSHENGSSLELRPAVNYYFGMEQKGLFIGRTICTPLASTLDLRPCCLKSLRWALPLVRMYL